MYTHLSSTNDDVSCVLFLTKFSSTLAYCYVYLFIMPMALFHFAVTLKVFCLAKNQAQQIHQQTQLNSTNVKPVSSNNNLRYVVMLSYLLIAFSLQIILANLAVLNPPLIKGRTINLFLIIFLLFSSNRGIVQFIAMKTLRQSVIKHLALYDCVN